jgi:hypothetical protein
MEGRHRRRSTFTESAAVGHLPAEAVALKTQRFHFFWQGNLPFATVTGMVE